VTDLSPALLPAVIRVLIVDDHTLLRAGIAQLLGHTSDIVLVGEAADGAEAIEAVAELLPDVVLMDLSMPGLDGCAATRRIHDVYPDVRIVVLSSYVDRSDVLDALDAGAVGYLLKDSRPEELVLGIRSAAGDGSPLAPRAAREVLTDWRHTHEPRELTTRERDVLALLADGMANKLIAYRLGISEKTVKGHVTRIFQVLGVSDRTQAALWVGRHGLPAAQRERRDGESWMPAHPS
jgi:DNA-binding NarL/FixJ family response regulator